MAYLSVSFTVLLLFLWQHAIVYTAKYVSVSWLAIQTVPASLRDDTSFQLNALGYDLVAQSCVNLIQNCRGSYEFNIFCDIFWGLSILQNNKTDNKTRQECQGWDSIESYCKRFLSAEVLWWRLTHVCHSSTHFSVLTVVRMSIYNMAISIFSSMSLLFSARRRICCCIVGIMIQLFWLCLHCTSSITYCTLQMKYTAAQNTAWLPSFLSIKFPWQWNARAGKVAEISTTYHIQCRLN